MRRSGARKTRGVTADLARSLAGRRDFRTAVREIASFALASDASSRERLRGVLDALAQGISEGAMQARVDPELAVPEAFAGLEEAVERFVAHAAKEAGHDASWPAEVSGLLVEAAERAHSRAALRLRHAWAHVLESHARHGGMGAGGGAGPA